jgi:hypothetical protein
LKISFAPAECQAWAIAQAILRLFATPKTTPTLPSSGCELMGTDLPNKAVPRKCKPRIGKTNRRSTQINADKINRERTRMYTNKNPQMDAG